MSEKQAKIEQYDIAPPFLEAGGTAIVFQRHGKYNRDRGAEDAGSISEASAGEMYAHDKEMFDDLLKQEEIYVLFVSSDTRYAGKGYRSLETAQVAQDAAVAAFRQSDLDPNERIINFNPRFTTARHDDTDQAIRPIAGLREPQIFNPEDREYLQFLQESYGYADNETKTGLSPQAWAAHEMDAEKAERLKTGAEGQEDLIGRTMRSLSIIERYAKIWHANNPGKRLVVWAASHYDTISPIVKEARNTLRNNDGSLSDAYQPVDYGGGVVINIPPAPGERTLNARDTRLSLNLAGVATKFPGLSSMTGLNQPKH